MKLLDFGIAKVVKAWNEGTYSPATQTGQSIFTVPYASPEQLSGKPVTMASDVYSLGVLLYELLTGRRPHRLSDLLEHEVVKVILEEAPRPPSDAIAQKFEKKTAEGASKTVSPDELSATRQTTRKRLQRKLKGEIDHIVLMALRKEPGRRYVSASDLADDLRRHLEGLPVEAQPESARYRMRKFVTRYAWQVAAVAGLFLMLVAFSTVTLVQSQRIQAQAGMVAEEQQRAEAEAAEADQIVEILVALFRTANPSIVPGSDTLKVVDFLQQGETRLLQGLEELPAVQTRMKEVIGQMYRAQGNRPRAEQFFREALAQQADLKGADALETLVLVQQVGGMLARQGQRDSARVYFEEAIAGYRALDSEGEEQLARALLTLVPILPRGAYEEKEAMLAEANAIIDAGDFSTDIERASVANQFGVFYFNQGRFEASREPFEQALFWLEKAVGTSHNHYLVTEGNLAGVLSRLYLLDEAEAMHRQNLARRREVYRKPASIGVAFSLQQLASVLLLQNNPEEAEGFSEEALDMIVQLDGTEHPRWASYALTHVDILTRLQKFTEADVLLQSVLARRTAHFGRESVEVAEVYLRQGALYSAQEAWDASLEALDASLQTYYAHYPDSQHVGIAVGWLARGKVLLHQQRAEQALEPLQRALAYREVHSAGIPYLLSEAQVWTAIALSQTDQWDAAQALWQGGYSVFQEKNAATTADQRLLAAMQDRMKEAAKK